MARLKALIKEERDFSNISPETLEIIREFSLNFDHIHSQLVGVAFGTDDFLGLPFQFLAKDGPNFFSSNLKLLDILFASLFKGEKPSQKQTRIFGQIKYLMGFAGYFVGRLRYTVDELENDSLGSAIASIISELLGLRALLKKESPKHAESLWISAFDKLALGYGMALDEILWPEDSRLEEQLLACMLHNQEAFEYVTSKLSTPDFSEKNSGIYVEIHLHRRAKEAKKALNEDITKHLDEIWSELGPDPEQEVGVLLENVPDIKLFSLIRDMQTDLLRLASEFRITVNFPKLETVERLEGIASEIHALGRPRWKEDESD